MKSPFEHIAQSEPHVSATLMAASLKGLRRIQPFIDVPLAPVGPIRRSSAGDAAAGDDDAAAAPGGSDAPDGRDTRRVCIRRVGAPRQ